MTFFNIAISLPAYAADSTLSGLTACGTSTGISCSTFDPTGVLGKAISVRVAVCEADLRSRGLNCDELTLQNEDQRACSPTRFCSSDGGLRESFIELQNCGLETIKPFWEAILAPLEIGKAVTSDIFKSVWLCTINKSCGTPKLSAEELVSMAEEREKFNTGLIIQERSEEAALCSEKKRGYGCPIPNISCREWDDVIQGHQVVARGVLYTSTSVSAEDGFNKGNFCKEALKRFSSSRDDLRESSVRRATEGFSLYLKDLMTPWACLQPKFAARRFCALRGEVLSAFLLPLAMTRSLSWAREGKSALEIRNLLKKSSESLKTNSRLVSPLNPSGVPRTITEKIISNLEQRGVLTSHDGNPVRKFTKGEISNVSLFSKGSNTGVQYEGGIVQRGSNLALNRSVEALEREKGEVRSLMKENFSLLNKASVDNLSYFRTEPDGTPIVVLEKGASPAVVAHEMEHFNDWLLAKKRFLAEGFSEEEARFKAGKYIVSKDPEIVRGMESRAVAVQNKILGLQLSSPEVIERITYPERTAIARAIARAKLEKRTLTPRERAETNKYAEIALVKAIKIHELRVLRESESLPDKGTQVRNTAGVAENSILTHSQDILEEMGIHPDSGIFAIFSERLPVVEEVLRTRK